MCCGQRVPVLGGGRGGPLYTIGLVTVGETRRPATSPLFLLRRVANNARCRMHPFYTRCPPGVWSDSTRRYALSIPASSLPADTYRALLSVRHPAANGSLALVSFYVTVMPPPSPPPSPTIGGWPWFG